jgi:undecaprenyl-diphosphatase
VGHLADLSSPWAYIIIGALAALEAAAFIGLVVPGEIALLAGGYLASIGRVNLGAMIAVAVAAAIVGDSIGYEVGRHLGGRLRASRAGRRIGEERWGKAEQFLHRHGGPAVFLGRFVGVLRALIPGLAGATHMPYRRFLVWNALGGATWATAMVLLGDVAGKSYERVAHQAGNAGLLLLAIAVAVGAVLLAARWIGRRPDRVRAMWERQLARPRISAVRSRYAKQIAFLTRRFQPGTALGLVLTAQLAALAASGWLLGAVLQDVLQGESNAFDGAVTRWFVRHREPWLTSIMRTVTAFGSTTVLIPLVVISGLALYRRRGSWLPLATLAAAQAGAIVLYDTIKLLVHRPRPSVGPLVATASGYSFPSGHATQSMAVYVTLALVLSAGRDMRTRTAAVAAAVIITLLIGVSRVYLGVHWATDVIAGWALGAAWIVALATAIRIVTVRRTVPRLARSTDRSR